eukprot:scaffold31105_cov59-Phaeocystis_antarctica.AAC.2
MIVSCTPAPRGGIERKDSKIKRWVNLDTSLGPCLAYTRLSHQARHFRAHWRSSYAAPIGAAGAVGAGGAGDADGRAGGRWLRGETQGMMHATLSTSFMSFSPATLAASRP